MRWAGWAYRSAGLGYVLNALWPQNRSLCGVPVYRLMNFSDILPQQHHCSTVQASKWVLYLIYCQ